MSEAITLSGLEQVAHVTSVIGKGGAYIAICGVLSAYCLRDRLRLGGARLAPKLNELERLTWSLWAYWVFGTSLNQALKFSIQQARPWWVDVSLAPLSPQPSMGFGMPSGHAQGAVGLWLLAYLARQVSAQSTRPVARLWLILLTLVCAVWVPLTMWARVTLHAHSVPQVCAGMGLGVIWALSLNKLTTATRGPLLLSLMSALCLGTLLYHMSTPPTLPQAWLEVIRAHSAEPLWFQPKLKVFIGLTLASIGLIWASLRDVRARSGSS